MPVDLLRRMVLPCKFYVSADIKTCETPALNETVPAKCRGLRRTPARRDETR
jgi:hypothetical protein